MKILFLNAPYKGEVKLFDKTLKYIKKNNIKNVGLYASVQFFNKLDNVLKQLDELEINVISSQPSRTHAKHQILGCDVFHDSLNLTEEQFNSVDVFLYIGDGNFHPFALLYGQKENEIIKEILCNDPIAEKFNVVSVNDIKKYLKRHKGALMRFLQAKKVGVIISMKTGQEQMNHGLKLEDKYTDKEFFYFLDDTISFNQLENFPFIEVWVNTACPRIGIDDQDKFNKSVINITDALRAEYVLSKVLI